MIRTVRAVACGMTLVGLMAPAMAEEVRETGKAQTQFDAPAASTTTTNASSARPTRMKDLIVDGFEVKTVNVVPRDIVMAGGSTVEIDAVLILLQKGPQLANCYVGYQNFVNGSYFNADSGGCTVHK